MVKRVDVLRRALDEDADVPYEETRLARRAKRARPRLAGVLAVGAAALVLEAAATQAWAWLLPAALVAAAAWGVRRGRLGGVVAAGLAGVLAALLPLRLAFVADLAPADAVAGLVSVALGIAAVPDVVTLLRDAELRHAYGVWAVRD